MVTAAAMLAVNVIKGSFTAKYTKEMAKSQREVAEMYAEYNKKKLQENYEKAYSGAMINYVNSRVNQAEEMSEAKTKINMMTVGQGIDIEGSSYENDIKDQLDTEYTLNLQNSFDNLVSRTAQLAVDKGTAEFQLNQQRDNQISSINNSESKVIDSVNNKIFSSVIGLASSGFDAYSDANAKSAIKEGRESSVSNSDTSFSNLLKSFK